METEGITVAVTVAVALACACVLCGIDTKAIMTTLAIIMIVLIVHKNARTMPKHYSILIIYSLLTLCKSITYVGSKTDSDGL
jgi:hypothetical protein